MVSYLVKRSANIKTIVTIESMKKVFITSLLALLLATPAFAGSNGVPNENSVGIGSFFLVRAGLQQLRHMFPLFITFEPDHDGKIEGRADTFYMTRHMNEVQDMQNSN